jgi:hypothetical protein
MTSFPTVLGAVALVVVVVLKGAQDLSTVWVW